MENYIPENFYFGNLAAKMLGFPAYMDTNKLTIECPTCKKVIAYQNNPFRPFCSKRCRLIDLGDWASEKHRIPGEKVDPSKLPDKD
jgi:uncharacterized protein